MIGRKRRGLWIVLFGAACALFLFFVLRGRLGESGLSQSDHQGKASASARFSVLLNRIPETEPGQASLRSKLPNELSETTSPAVKVEGIVQDEETGHAIPFANLFLFLGASVSDIDDEEKFFERWENAVIRSKSDTGGAFSIPILTPSMGKAVLLTLADKQGFLESYQDISLPPDGPLIVTLLRRPGERWIFRIRVLDDRTGEPVSEIDANAAEASAALAPTRDETGKPIVSDFEATWTPHATSSRMRSASGEYDVPFPIGKWSIEGSKHIYRLLIRASGYEAAFLGPLDPTKETNTVRLRRGGATLLGQVVAADSGEPIRKSRIQWTEKNVPAEVKSDDQGRFRALSLQREKPQLFEVSALGFASRWMVFNFSSDREVRVELNRGGTIEGVVRDEAGSPRRGVKVFAVTTVSISGDSLEEYRFFNRRVDTYTDSEGKFSFESVPVGSCVVFLELERTESHWTPGSSDHRRFEIVEGAREALHFGGVPTGSVRGKLLERNLDRSNSRVTKGALSICLTRRKDDSESPSLEVLRQTDYEVVVNPEREWAIPGVIPGKYYLVIFRNASSFCCVRSIEVKANEKTDLGALVVFMDADFDFTQRMENLSPEDRSRREEERARYR